MTRDDVAPTAPKPLPLGHLPEPAGSADQWRRHARLLAVAAVVLLVAGSALSIAVDPRDQFAHQWVAPLPWDEPAIKKHHFDAMEPAPYTLVLGNSRVMKLDPDRISAHTNQTAFNWGLSGTTLEDSLRLLQHFIATDRAPGEILVGVASARLAPGVAPSDRTQDILGPMHGRPGVTATIEAAFDTLSPWYLGDSLGSLATATGVAYLAQTSFDQDGLIHYLPVERQQQAGTFDGLARVQGQVRGYQGDGLAPTIDSERWGTLVQLVEVARAADVEVRLFIPTTHPALLEMSAAETYVQRLGLVRDALHELCLPGVSVQDFSEVSLYGGDPADFYDAFHVLDGNAARLVDAIYAGTSALC